MNSIHFNVKYKFYQLLLCFPYKIINKFIKEKFFLKEIEKFKQKIYL